MGLALVSQLDHVALSVADLDRSRRWYEDILGLDRRYDDAWPEFPVVLCAGEACVALFPRRGDERAGDAGGGFRHVAFRTDRAGFEASRHALGRHGVELHFEDHGICHSLYLSDPDGYQVEITTYDVAER
jgi:catechol 2,3-dioxygenase-like lactoylglutathione lyase family enzyme